MHTQLKADLMLVLVTFFWGISYLLTDLALTEVGVFSLNAIRFLLAFAVGGLCFLPRLRHPSAATLKTAIATGAALFCVYTATTFGVKYTSLSNAGFLCALPVVFTPLLDFLFFRRRPSRKLALVLVMAVTGIALLTLSDDLRPALGDVLCILCALSNAVYLIITERAVARPEVDAFQLGVYQQLVTGLGMLVLSIFLEGPDLPRTPAVWASVLVLSLFCTGAAFLIQSVALQYTTASHVGVIFCLEPVFNSIFAFFVAHEVLSPRAYAGASLLMLGILVMAVDLAALLRPLRRKNPRPGPVPTQKPAGRCQRQRPAYCLWTLDQPLLLMYASMDLAACLPAPMARMTVAAPVAASPPANTPGRLV